MRARARKTGGFRLEVFTDEELNGTHLATLEVLARTGVFVEDDEALDIFAEGAAAVGGRPLGKLPLAALGHAAPISPLAVATASIASSA